MYLSKTDFKVARSCPAKLYYKKRGYPSVKDDEEYLELLAEGGFMVQKIAGLLYPEGREVPFAAAPETAAAETLRALEADRLTLFEATLINNASAADFPLPDGPVTRQGLVSARVTNTLNSSCNCCRPT